MALVLFTKERGKKVSRRLRFLKKYLCISMDRGRCLISGGGVGGVILANSSNFHGSVPPG